MDGKSKKAHSDKGITKEADNGKDANRKTKKIEHSDTNRKGGTQEGSKDVVMDGSELDEKGKKRNTTSDELTDKECSNRCMVQSTLSFAANPPAGSKEEMRLLGRRTGAVMGKPVGEYVPRQGGRKVSEVVKDYYKCVEKTMKNRSGNGEDEKEEDEQEGGKRAGERKEQREG